MINTETVYMYEQLQPYFRNGELVLPEKLVKVLLGVGLDWRIAHSAARGISLDDTASLGEIYRTVEVLLQQLAPTNPLYIVLSSNETRFMLTGKPV